MQANKMVLWIVIFGLSSGFAVSSVGLAAEITTGSALDDGMMLVYVAYSGDGTLSIDAGSVVKRMYGYIGYNPGVTGLATVTGAGSQWNNSSALYVGYSGSGKLTVTDGGQVTAATLYASLSDLSGNGTITVTQGAALDADLVFDATHGLTQTIPFGTGGSLNLTATTGGILSAGYKGAGALRIADGVQVTSASGYLGYNSGSTGIATVTGAGSLWNNKEPRINNLSKSL